MKKILYVEDLIMAVNIVKKMCQNKYDVHHALNVETGLEKIKTETFDLILLDINLQQPMDGLVLASILKDEKLFENKPIILVTAYQFDFDSQELKNLGLSGYLQKPFTKSDLLTILEDFI
ncbi:MAG TPA: response regulator [Melioribacteraceae bacterium]|nr:response regulator [Melioribacteraceae bacterium]